MTGTRRRGTCTMTFQVRPVSSARAAVAAAASPLASICTRCSPAPAPRTHSSFTRRDHARLAGRLRKARELARRSFAQVAAQHQVQGPCHRSRALLFVAGRGAHGVWLPAARALTHGHLYASAPSRYPLPAARNSKPRSKAARRSAAPFPRRRSRSRSAFSSVASPIRCTARSRTSASATRRRRR